MKPKIFRACVITLAAAVLTACGGSDSDDISPSHADPTSYWTMDSHEYVNGGHSAVSSTSPNGVLVTTAVVSTATLSGGDNSNGAYSGSALTFSFKGTSATGVYTVVPDQASFNAAAADTASILVGVTVGAATTTGSSQYAVSSGQVRVTQDASGAYHFTSVAAMPAAKTVDVLGGVTGAPADMTLSITDAF